MKRKKWWVVLLVLGLLLPACQQLRSPKSVKIAVDLTLELDVAKNMENAAHLALETAGGKAGDVDVELVVFNTSDPEGATISKELEEEVATTVANDEDFVGYIGPLASSQARISLPILNEAGVPQISPSTTWPGLTKPGFAPGEPGLYYPTGRRHFFRTVPADDIQGVLAADWAQSLGFENVYIVTDGTAYGAGLGGIFQSNAQDLDLEVVGFAEFAGEDYTIGDLREIAEQIVAAEPDMVYLGAGLGTGAIDFASQLIELAPDTSLMGPDFIVNDDFITGVGAPAAEGTYGTNVLVPPEQLDSAADFFAAYREAYGEDPHPFALATYEAVGVMLEALAQADSPTRGDLLTALGNLGNYEGALGTWSFDERGDISVTLISGMRIRDGEWEFVKALR